MIMCYFFGLFMWVQFVIRIYRAAAVGGAVVLDQSFEI